MTTGLSRSMPASSKTLAQRLRRQQLAVPRQRRGRHAGGARHMAAAHAGARLRLGAGEAAGRPRIGDLPLAGLDDAAHFGEVGDPARRRNRQSKTLGAILVGSAVTGRPVGLPAVEAAFQHVDLLRAHRCGTSTSARRREQARAVIDDDGVVGRNAHRADHAGKDAGRRQRVRQRRIRDRRPRPGRRTPRPEYGRLILGARVALLRRQIPGRVDDRQAGLAEPLLQPVGDRR